MSGSDRGELTKTGLIATIFVAALTIAAYWLMIYDAGYQSGQNERKANVESAHYAADTANQIERKCGTKVGQSARECIAEIVKAERESQRSESDLAAQWEAADWARWAGFAALAQFIATIIGLYYIKGTLDATLKAVEDTGKATKAMLRQNDLTEDTAQKQLRAYVDICDDFTKIERNPLRDKDDRIAAKVTISVRNYGQTPAKYARTNVSHMVLENNFDSYPFLDKTDVEWQPAFDIPPGGRLTIPHQANFSQEIYDRILRGECSMVIIAFFAYEDVYGVNRETKFAMQATSVQFEDGDFAVIRNMFLAT